MSRAANARRDCNGTSDRTPRNSIIQPKRGERKMGKKGTPKYSSEFKFDAVRLVVEEGLSQAEVARRLGITANSISDWVRAYKKDKGQAFPGKGRQTPEQEKIRQLEKENRELRMERDILKKATAFFAKEVK